MSTENSFQSVRVLERPLSSMEKAVWLARHAGTHNCLAIAEIEGPLTAESLRKALDYIQKRHPLLQMRICTGKKGAVFRNTPDVPLIPLRIVDVPEGQWVEEAECELRVHLPIDTGPLLRCVMLRHSPTTSTLLLNYFHAVADGFACGYLLRDLLLAATHDRDPAQSEPSPLPLPLSMEERIPRTAKGLLGVLRLFWLIAREFVENLMKGGIPRKLTFDCWPSYEERRSRILPFEFDKEFTDCLKARAQREQTTVHGALCAAGLLAVSRIMTDGSPRLLACTSSVDMRTRLDPPVKDEQGLFVSVLWSVQRVWKDRPFWDLAREVRRNLFRKIASGGHFAVLAGSSWLVPLLERLLPEGKEGSIRFSRIAESTMINYKGTGVSNGGAMELGGGVGPFKIRSFRGGVTLLNTGYFTALVSSFNGTLYINYIYNEPMITRARAQQLAETAVELLKKAIE